MIEKIKQKTFALLNQLHWLVFRSEMGEGTKRFIKNISYTSLGNIGATLFLFAVNIVAVRALGPAEYGKYTLVLSIANFVFIPMTLGLPVSLMKYLPENLGNKKEQDSTIATAFWSMLAFTLITASILYFFKDYSTLFAIPVSIFLLAIIYTIFDVAKKFADSVLKGLYQFGLGAVLGVIYAFAIFIAFFSLFFLWERNFNIYVWSVMTGFVVYFLVFVFWNKVDFRLSLFNKDKLQILFQYGFYSILNSPSWFLITNADRFLLNNFTDVKTVGIYAVYSSASMIIIGRGLSYFINVFFPTVAGIQDKAAVNYKINKLLKLVFFPLLLVNCLIMYLMLLIYGKDYPINFLWLIIFSLSALLYALVHVKWNIIIAKGAETLRAYAVHSFLGAVGNFVLNWFLISKLGISGAVIAAIVTYLYFLLAASFYLRSSK